MDLTEIINALKTKISSTKRKKQLASWKQICDDKAKSCQSMGEIERKKEIERLKAEAFMLFGWKF